MIYRFELGKRDSILLAAGALLLAVVLFFAGFLTDRIVSTRPVLAKAVEGTSTHADAGISPPSSEQTVPTHPATKSEPAPKTQEPPAAATAVREPVPNAAAGSSTNVQLAVQVGVFADPAKAKHMVEQLQKEGFSPVVASRTGNDNQQLSVVQIGPFAAWEDASRVAQVIGRSLRARPAIRPML